MSIVPAIKKVKLLVKLQTTNFPENVKFDSLSLRSKHLNLTTKQILPANLILIVVILKEEGSRGNKIEERY